MGRGAAIMRRGPDIRWLCSALVWGWRRLLDYIPNRGTLARRTRHLVFGGRLRGDIVFRLHSPVRRETSDTSDVSEEVRDLIKKARPLVQEARTRFESGMLLEKLCCVVDSGAVITAHIEEIVEKDTKRYHHLLAVYSSRLEHPYKKGYAYCTLSHVDAKRPMAGLSE